MKRVFFIIPTLFAIASCGTSTSVIPENDPNANVFNIKYQVVGRYTTQKLNTLISFNKNNYLHIKDESSYQNVFNIINSQSTYETKPREIDFTTSSVVLLYTEYTSSEVNYDLSSIVYSNGQLDVWLCDAYDDTKIMDGHYQSRMIFCEIDKVEKVKVNFVVKHHEYIEQATTLKPIIYFYPEQEMDLSVTYYDPSKLITTYPKYNDGWNIHLKEDGTFTTNEDNREYYALYFDEVSNYECSFNEGFFVNKDNAITFLEEKLDYMGYTNREADEFIMYWLPVLENNGNSIVYFEQTEEREQECPLTFSTTPDSILRTIIHIKQVDGDQDIKEQELTKFERTGFTVVEWGGTIH